MKLVHIKTGFVVVEYLQGETLFGDPFLKKEMHLKGVLIPPFLRAEFGGKARIRIEDPHFQRAFKEVYYPLSINPQTYRWSCT